MARLCEHRGECRAGAGPVVEALSPGGARSPDRFERRAQKVAVSRIVDLIVVGVIASALVIRGEQLLAVDGHETALRAVPKAAPEGDPG
jgi:hypothetical protein